MKNLWRGRREKNNTVSLIESISFRWYALLILSRILMKSMIYYSIIEYVKIIWHVLYEKGSGTMRRNDGRETWFRLLEWDKGQHQQNVWRQ